MVKVKTGRVFGARGINVINSSLNAGFDGRPKTLASGEFFNSDVSSKFLDREYMRNMGEKVLIKKKYLKNNKGEVYAATLEEILKSSLKDCSKGKKFAKEIAEVVTEYVDVQNYGALLTPFGFGITGVVQYTQGINKIQDCSNVIVQDLGSPYGTANNAKQKAKKEKEKEKEDGDEEGSSTATNIGKHIFVDRAVYVQGFSVNPQNLNSLVEVIGNKDFVGYTEKSYDIFKKSVLASATAYTSRSKIGCYDMFAVFVNMKDDSLKYLPNLEEDIDVLAQEDNKDIVVDLTKLSYLNQMSDVESVEVYYNPRMCKLVHKFESVEIKDILLDT